MELRTPEEVMKDVQGKRFRLLCDTEKKIVKEIESHFVGDPLEFWLDGYETKYKPILETLKEKFAQFNWRLELIQTMTDQRDGDATKFRISRLKV